MNAKLVLQLWRERWGKGREGLPNKSYVRGSVYQWAEKIPGASAWSTPGLSFGIMCASLLFFLLSISIEFSLNGQITFAGLMVIAALFLRRYDGALVTLTLICLSMLCSAQYFVWRFGTTLVAQAEAAFFVSFTLCAVELCVVFYLLLGWIRRLWPLEQAEAELFAKASELPSVDIFLLVAELDSETVIQSALACTQMTWPAKKLKLYVIDTEPRTILEKNVTRLGAVYLSQARVGHQFESKTSAIQRGMDQSAGDFILVLERQSLPIKNFLERVLAWFDNDVGLSLLYTSDHSLAPTLSPKLEQDRTSVLPGLSFAMLRRATWQSELKSMWQRSALVIFNSESVNEMTVSPQPAISMTMIRIDRADSNTVLSWKRKVSQLHSLLQFYRPLAYFACLLAPLVFLLQGITLVNATLDWFACFALPAVILIGVVQSRNTQDGRWAELRELKELSLSAYMVLATSVSYLQTALFRPQLIVARWRSELSLAQWLYGLLISLLLILNLAAFVIGVARVYEPEQAKLQWTLSYTLWAFVNVMLLLSRQAIFQESSQIKWFSKRQQSLSAMIRLPFGRTLSCKTLNFPAAELELQTPAPFNSAANEELKLLIFHNNQATALTVQTLRTEGLTTYVRLIGGQGAELTQLKEAVFARGKDWPMWLPDRQADHPLPLWLSRLLAAVPIKLLDVSMNLSSYLRLDRLTHFWKGKK
jgi:cellulose synthase (UDP-forming)